MTKVERCAQVYDDLHNEFGDHVLNAPKGDILITAALLVVAESLDASRSAFLSAALSMRIGADKSLKEPRE